MPTGQGPRQELSGPLIALAAGVVLLLIHPLTWNGRVSLWSAPPGLAFVLAGWFGWRFALGATTMAGLGLVIGTVLTGARDDGGIALSWAASEAVLGVAEPLLGWWLYHVRAQGSRRLADPRSATQFVLLVPGLTAASTALPRVALAWLLAPPGLPAGGPGTLLAIVWMEHALGLMVVAPPLLVVFTPWLARRGLLPADDPRPAGPPTASVLTARDAEMEPATRSPWSDRVEIAGLAISSSILCLGLSGLPGQRELLGWQLWGVQLLLIVWASLRQGLRGGTIVASCSALVPLLARSFWGVRPHDPVFLPLLQGHLLAQGSVAVLVAAASAWARLHETGYRQVVAHIPVVIYSARLIRTPGRLPGAPPGASVHGVAEVTLVSAASARLLGSTADHLLGDHSRWLDGVHAEDREVLLAAIEQLARQEQPVTCEYRLAHASGPRGAPRWVRDTLAPRRDAEGRLVGWEGVVIDITEQRALADDLRRTTSMFHALVANLPAGVFFVQGPHGQPILVNARARQLLGQREDFSASLEHLPRVYRLCRPDGTLYPAEELPVYLALRQGRTAMRDDIVVHRPDGRRVPLVSWAAPIQLGAPTGADAAVWVLEDFSAVHQAEAARKDTEGRLRAIIETMAEGLLVHDARGRIVSSNPAACAFFGWPAEKLCGRTLHDIEWTFRREDGTLLPAEEHPAWLALRLGHPVRNVILAAMRTSADSPPTSPLAQRWILVNAMPLGVRHGPSEAPDRPGDATGVAGVVTTFSDLSAYVHAREGVRSSETRYRHLVESLPIILIQTDRNLRVTYANPAMQAITGYELEEVAEPTVWGSFVHPDDLGRVSEMAHSALAGQPYRTELRFRAKDGSDKVCYALAQPRYQDGLVVGATTLLVDVTRERQLERELQRAQRLELIGRLSSGVAHDFNNLVSVVLNLADLARAHLPANHPTHVDLQRIREAGEQAAGLAGQLLAFSKQRPAAPRRIDVNGAVRRTLELLRTSLPADVQVEADLAEGELFVQAEQTQMQQVLMNLCLNARDAMPGGGVLRVATGREGTASLPTWVKLSVEDSGMGMSPEVRGRIFEPFFSTKDGGTGLGLAVVQQIVEGHGGRIAVTSKPGAGTRFEIIWPAA